MPAVFIHGVPDTFRIWSPVTALLARKDVVSLALPGFDSPPPRGFVATKESYVNWIIAEIERLGEPVDLVGHDWGCIFGVRVASVRPDLVRTWAGGGGPVSQNYEWHALAKLLQTPNEGEKWVADFDAEQFGSQLEQFGLPPGFVEQTLRRVDQPMLRCILELYRSAVNVGSEWQPNLSTICSPGLVVWGERDNGCPPSFADELARDTKARRVLKLNAGHWFPLEKPREVAAALEEHWSDMAPQNGLPMLKDFA